jgi:hypothetical protein
MSVLHILTTFAASVDLGGLPRPAADRAHLQTALNIFFGIMGSISFIVLIIAGMRYVTSNGDPGTMSKTKNTIIYASIGMAVSMSAFAIVSFVISKV